MKINGEIEFVSCSINFQYNSTKSADMLQYFRKFVVSE